MGRTVFKLPDLVIPNGGSQANIILYDGSANVDLIIYSPAALTGVVTVQVAPFLATGVAIAAGDLRKLQVTPGTDFVLAAGKATVIPIAAYAALSIISAAAEGAARTFIVMAQEDLGFRA